MAALKRNIIPPESASLRLQRRSHASNVMGLDRKRGMALFPKSMTRTRGRIRSNNLSQKFWTGSRAINHIYGSAINVKLDAMRGVSGDQSSMLLHEHRGPAFSE
jgi:hypothetical protein